MCFEVFYYSVGYFHGSRDALLQFRLIKEGETPKSEDTNDDMNIQLCIYRR